MLHEINETPKCICRERISSRSCLIIFCIFVHVSLSVSVARRVKSVINAFILLIISSWIDSIISLFSLVTSSRRVTSSSRRLIYKGVISYRYNLSCRKIYKWAETLVYHFLGMIIGTIFYGCYRSVDGVYVNLGCFDDNRYVRVGLFMNCAYLYTKHEKDET